MTRNRQIRRNFKVIVKRRGRLTWGEPEDRNPRNIGAPWADAYLQGAFDDLCPGCGVHATENGGLCDTCTRETRS